MASNLGIYLGSFNPIHNNHLAVAQYAQETFNLDEVIFIVSPQNPFKDAKTLINEEIRVKMVADAIATYPKLSFSTIELKLPKPSYTYQTLEKLNECIPNAHLNLICGFDNLESLSSWKNFEIILNNLYRIIVFPRINNDNNQTLNWQKEYIKQCQAQWKNINPNLTIEFASNFPMSQISASWIRNNILTHPQTCRLMLPSSVWDIIQNEPLYQK